MIVKKRSIISLVISLPIFFWLLQGCDSQVKRKEAKKSDVLIETKALGTQSEESKEPAVDIRVRYNIIHVQSPDGTRMTWKVSSEGVKDIKPILAVYQPDTIGSINLYKINSWIDMNKLTTAIQQDRDKMIWSLFDEISHLKSRVKELEKKLSDLSKEKSINDN
jgi:hypothetical protein